MRFAVHRLAQMLSHRLHGVLPRPVSETFELELDRRPFAQPSCQAFEAPEETSMFVFEEGQASAERAGMV